MDKLIRQTDCVGTARVIRKGIPTEINLKYNKNNNILQCTEENK